MATTQRPSNSILTELRGAAPLTKQISDALRHAVASGQLAGGVRLPSTRALADQLAVSRNTVLDAYAQLESEGYLKTRRGSGTFVAASLPESKLRRRRAATPTPNAPAQLSDYGTSLARGELLTSDGPPRAFSLGIPSIKPDELGAWLRSVQRSCRRLTTELLSYGDAAGSATLREAIAAYVGPTRGLECTADQVFVTGGTQQALDLALRVLVNRTDHVWIEDPAYGGVRAAIEAAGSTIVPVSIDAEGLRVEEGRALAPRAKLACVSPSHQYPLGVTMSVRRREELLDWATAAGAWIVEDDYDSEFRYGGRPLPALQSLDRTGRVLYFATFSKVLFPGLRMGYLIVPPALVPVFRRAVGAIWNGASAINQAALADFIGAGHLARHIRKMRVRYEQRRTWLVDLLRERASDVLNVTGEHAGLHVTARFTRPIDDRDVARRGSARGLVLPTLSEHFMGPNRESGLVLGYGHLDRKAITAGVDELMSVLRVL